MSMNWDLILKYLEVLAWPTVVLIVCYWFKNEVGGLINRIAGGKLPGGFEFSSPPSQKPPSENVPKEIKESVALKEEKNKKEKNKKEKKIVTSPTTTDLQQQISASLSQIAGLQTALIFERTYQNIFGSQIKLLDELRLRGLVGALYEDIAAYYQQIKIKWAGLNSYPLEDYLNYLKNAGLVTLFYDDAQRKYKITPSGVDFLEYIEKLKYSKDKNL